MYICAKSVTTARTTITALHCSVYYLQPGVEAGVLPARNKLAETTHSSHCTVVCYSQPDVGKNEREAPQPGVEACVQTAQHARNEHEASRCSASYHRQVLRLVYCLPSSTRNKREQRCATAKCSVRCTGDPARPRPWPAPAGRPPARGDV
jgi:hypothetical protein